MARQRPTAPHQTPDRVLSLGSQHAKDIEGSVPRLVVSSRRGKWPAQHCLSDAPSPCSPSRSSQAHSKSTWLWVKNMYPKWVAPVNGNMDQNLQSPGGLILTHTHIRTPAVEEHQLLLVQEAPQRLGIACDCTCTFPSKAAASDGKSAWPKENLRDGLKHQADDGNQRDLTTTTQVYADSSGRMAKRCHLKCTGERPHGLRTSMPSRTQGQATTKRTV